MIPNHLLSTKWTQRINRNFLLVIFVLSIIGLINLYSATHGVTIDGNQKLFWQQMIWFVGAWIVFFILTKVDYNFFKRMAYIIYGLNVLALASVSFFGTTILGAKRWLDLGFFKFQPSETIKISLVLVLASFLSQKKFPKGLGFRQLVIPAILTFIPFIFIVRQPDLGTSLLIVSVSFSMLFFVGIKTSIIVFAILIGFVSTPLVWNFGLKNYQKERIITFFSPLHEPRGAGYNSIQSKIAVGSGSFVGKGFRKGTQSQLEFIPERHSDFIYSVLSEEHGFVGSVTTFALFLVLFTMIIRISSNAASSFAALMVIGLGAILFWHVIINIGMVTGLLPIVGVPLPILSKGGSSLLTTFAALGLISSVAYRRYVF